VIHLLVWRSASGMLNPLSFFMDQNKGTLWLLILNVNSASRFC
jgi:hypothetical protein